IVAASDSAFLSALQPNSSVTTYGLPSNTRLENGGGSASDEVARAQRVQQQVQMRLSQKSTLPRQNGSNYGGSSTVKYKTYSPNFTSKSSYMYTGAGTMVSTVELSLINYHLHTSYGLSMQAVGQHMGQINPWMVDTSDAGSMISDRDATFSRQYSQNTGNGYSQVRQGGSAMTLPGSTGGEVEIVHQQSFKGPAHRKINQIANRNRLGMGSVSGTLQRPMSMNGGTFGGGMDRGNIMMQRPGTLSRAMSIKSMHSVGRGMDIFGGQMEMGASMGNLSGITSLDMATAIQNLRDHDPELQVLGAAYIQHECYSDSDAKVEVRRLKGIGELVKLFNSENQEVQRFATGATRNLIYENMDNKVALIEEGGIPELVQALKENDDELRKNITGILWNLSSKDNLKQKLARETLPDLTEKILIPLSNSGDSDSVQLTPSEAEILYNTMGCLRNMSSVNEKTRQQMREMPGLVDSLVGYIKASLEENNTQDKGIENAVCILRNLSYQLYSEIPPSASLRLDGPTRDQSSGKGEAIGCFTPHSRKAKNSKNQDLSTFTEVARVPRGMEWLWHPQILGGGLGKRRAY
uniref:Uncharacterized protein n=1 Tax=Mola mola TaxID=94237 RepID=A0A3Q3WWX2_MOLML